MESTARNCAVICAIALGICGQCADAGELSQFKPGDRVEVEHFGKKANGVVVGIDKRFDQLEIRVDDDGTLPAKMPAEVRQRFLTITADPDDVRLIGGGKAEAPAESEPMRTWKDRTGKFNIKATYQGMRDGKVILDTEKGKRIEVPLEKLADDDAQFAREQENDDENPFNKLAGESSTTPAPISNQLKAKTDQAKMVQPKTFKAWSFQSTPRAVETNSNIVGQQIRLNSIPDSDAFFEKLHGIHVSDDGNRVILSREQGKVGDGQHYIEGIELANGQTGNLVALPQTTALLDAWPSENLIAFRPDHFGSGKNGLLTVVQLENDKLVPVASWYPYENEDWAPSKDIEKAWFLSADRILTINGHGTALTAWNIRDAKAEFYIPVTWSHDISIALSPDRGTLAIAMESGIALIDVREGKHVATLPMQENAHVRSIAFKDDLQRLAAYSGKGVTVWDLTSGKELQTFQHSSMGSNKSLGWAGDFVSLDDHYLYDMARGILLWEYTGGKNPLSASLIQNGRLWAAAAPTRQSIGLCFTAKYPHSAASELAGQLGTLEDLLIAKPGDKFAIKVDVDPGIAPSEEVRSAIAANLTAAGFVVADDADLVVTAVCKSKESQTIKINTGTNQFRPNPQDIVEKTITPHATFMQLTLRGENVWEQGYLAKPGTMIWINKGETLDQALERMTRPNVDMLKKFAFAAYMTRPGKATDNGAYGTSPFAADE